MRLTIRTLLLMFTSLAALAEWQPTQAALLYAISGDSSGIPRQLNQIDTDTETVTAVTILGDTGTGFNGGLTWDGSQERFYSIYSYGWGNAALASFGLSGDGYQTEGAILLQGGLWRGLSYAGDSGLLYALYSVGNGAWQLEEINLQTGSVQTRFSGMQGGVGGMTWVAPGKLAVLLMNLQGLYQIHELDLTTGSLTTVGAPFAGNANGGLAWDAASGNYLAIVSNWQGASAVHPVSASGNGAPQTPFPIGGGYFYGGLTSVAASVPNVEPVPEVSTIWLALTGIGLVAISRVRRFSTR